MKTATQAATNYGTNGSSAAAQNLWAGEFVANIPKMQARAQAQATYWQTQVNTPEALANFKSGVATIDVPAVTTKVSTVGKASLAAGVKAASTGKYASFAAEFMPAVSTEIQNLDRTNPRGDKAQNRTRLNAYLDWLESQAGNFKQ